MLSGGTTYRLDGAGAAPGFRVATDGATALLGSSEGPATFHRRAAGGWAREGDVYPNGVVADDGFGWSVAVDGDLAVIGAYTEGPTFDDKPGAAYVYRWDGAEWSLEARLVREGSFRLGANVAVVGGDVIVSDGTRRPYRVDLAVYRRVDGAWTRVQTLVPDPTIVGAQGYSSSLAARGDLAVVGSKDGPLEAVTVLRRTAERWAVEAVVPAPNYDDVEDPLGAGARFGSSVATDGARIVVGAPGTNLVGQQSDGLAFVVSDGGSGWAISARLDNPGQVPFFAESVGIDGPTVAVGSEFEPGADDGRSGVVYPFSEQGGTWVADAPLSEPSAYSFGFQLALTRGVLVIGAPYDKRGNNDGRAYAYRAEGGHWVPDED